MYRKKENLDERMHRKFRYRNGVRKPREKMY